MPDRACAEWIESQNLSGVAGNVEMADAERASVLHAGLDCLGEPQLDFRKAQRPGGVSNVLQRHVRPHLVGPSKRDRGPRGELKGCGLCAAVRRLQTGQLSNVRPGRHIDRYRIAHSGGQTIILMGREEIAVVIFNVSRVEHPVDGGRK